MLRIGHRGACGYKPENTLASFSKALSLSVDMIEFDVQLSKDTSLVIIHDSTVNRTTDGSGYVSSKTIQQLKNLDAGNGEKIPTLPEALDLINRRSLVNIELKGKGTAGPVTQIIHRYVANQGWSYNDFYISSFLVDELAKIKQLKLETKIGFLCSSFGLADNLETATQLGAYSINISKRGATKKFVDHAHQQGLKVFVYTVNEEIEIARLKSLSVDGIFSDYPDRL
jgi:glycerophosphoryl diester phosphodiesterase